MATFTPQPEGLSDRLRQSGLYVSLLLVVASVYVAYYGSLVVAGGLVLLAAAITALSVPYDVFRETDRDLYLYNYADTSVRFDLAILAEGDEVRRPENVYELPPGEGLIVTDRFETDRQYTVSITVRGGRELRTDVTPVRSTESDGSTDPYVAFSTTVIRSGWHRSDEPEFSDRVSSRVYGLSSSKPGAEIYHDW